MRKKKISERRKMHYYLFDAYRFSCEPFTPKLASCHDEKNDGLTLVNYSGILAYPEILDCRFFIRRRFSQKCGCGYASPRGLTTEPQNQPGQLPDAL